MRIAPSKGSLCAVVKRARMREGSHGVNGSAIPPTKLMAGDPASISRSIICCAAAAASSTIATASGSFAEAYARTRGASSAYAAGVALEANEQSSPGPTQNGRVWLQRVLFCRLVHQKPKACGGVLPDRSSSPPASSEISAPYPPTEIRCRLIMASPQEPVPNITIPPSAARWAPSQAT